MTNAVLRWARDEGLGVSERLSADDQLRLARLRDDGRVPRSLHEGVWGAAQDAARSPERVVRSAPSIVSSRSMGVVGLLAMTSETVGESLARLVRYSRVLKDDVHARLRVEGAELRVELWSVEPLAPVVADASLYSLHHLVQRWAGEPVPLREVSLRHPRVPGLSMDELFECPVRYEQPVDAVSFDRGVAELALHGAQPEVAAYLERLADAQLAEIEARGGGSIVPRLDAAIRERLHETTDIADVARRLHLSVRTLQRRLREEGLSYREVLDQTRWTVAAPLVAASELPLEEIAERVGYADGKAFRRAFRRWTGAAPSALRRRD